jgi:hypothetical protein
MEAFSDVFAFVAGLPAMTGLILTATTIFLTSDWRLAFTGLVLQYVLMGLALTRFIQVEVAIVKILAGILAVAILYLTARRIQEVQGGQQARAGSARFLGLHMSWGAGPLGLPFRLLAVLLVALAMIRFFDEIRLLLPMPAGDGAFAPAVPADVSFVAFWLAAMGMVGLIVSGESLRVAPAVLTIVTGFDLIYAGLQPNLAVVGFLGALTLLAALAFSYLAAVRSLGAALSLPDGEEAET